MPISKYSEADQKLYRALMKKYGSKKGKGIFYAMKNNGRLPSQRK